MKLLFDQNISHRIIKKIPPIFQYSKQVRELGLEDSSDIHIWNFAKANGFSIATFDADFSDIANMKGHPPKIIWLRTINQATNYIAKLLENHSLIIQEFIESNDYEEFSCLEING